MARNIVNINTTQTFQNWLDKTNEMAEAFRTNAITAATSGADSTTGDAELIGDFSATNLTATTQINTDQIASRTASATIDFTDPVNITGAAALVATFSQSSGALTRYTDTSVSWDVGLDGTSFIIDTGVDPKKFSLTTAGMLTVPNITLIEDITAGGDVTITGDVTAANFIGDGSQLTGVVSTGTLNALTDVVITSVQDQQVLKYDSATGNWINGADAGAGGGQDAGTLDGLDSTQFIRSDTNDSASGNYTFSGEITMSKSSGTILNLSGGGNARFGNDVTVINDASVGGDITVTGNVRAAGNVITKYSASDVALKENLEIINNALDKVQQVNGYTFNYKDTPEERVSGVIAQEIEKVLPEVVFNHEINNETYKAVRYDNIIPLLLEAIKELKGKVDDLETRLSDGE